MERIRETAESGIGGERAHRPGSNRNSRSDAAEGALFDQATEAYGLEAGARLDRFAQRGRGAEAADVHPRDALCEKTPLITLNLRVGAISGKRF